MCTGGRQALNDEQKILLSNKPIFERTMKEYEAIRQQLVEVAKEEAKKKPSVEVGGITVTRDINLLSRIA